MIRSKHLKPGMSLIEVIAAIAILAIFGSSLFLMQQFLFERMTVSQKKLIAAMRIDNELIAYQTEILKEMLEQQDAVEKSLAPHSKDFTAPDMTVSITTKSDFSESSLKNFKNLHFIVATAKNDDQDYGKLYMLLHIPKVTKK